MSNQLQQLAKRIRNELAMPQGENWRQVLLRQMANEVAGVRPAVISAETYAQLDEYGGFRHVVRNVYTYKFDPLKLEKLVEKARPLFRRIRTELLAFADFLEEAARD